MVVPAIQSLVADSTEEHERGIAFGWLQLTGNIGSIFGGFLSVILAGGSVLGIPGWRVSFHLVAIVSVVVGGLVRYYAVDPRFSRGRSPPPGKGGWQGFVEGIKAMAVEAKHVCQIRTFQIFVAQGVAGNFPWAALAFAPMWLELTGFSHNVTAALLGVFSVATSLGGLFGGKMGDILSLRMPNTGRIMLSQISSGLGVPLAGILLLWLPIDPSTPILHAILFFILGFFISWNAAATNNPIFAEIVPASARTSIYALDRSFESLLASFAPPLVGVLAENYYGYIPPKAGIDHVSELIIDKENALSLSKALYTAIGIPLTLCCLIYTLLYWTYPKDRDRARALALADAQLGSGYEFEKFNLEEENELDVIDVYGEPLDEEDDDDNYNNGSFSETERMYHTTKSTEPV
jgi:MFS family permease